MKKDQATLGLWFLSVVVFAVVVVCVWVFLLLLKPVTLSFEMWRHSLSKWDLKYKWCRF